MTDRSGKRIKDNSFWWSLFYLALGSSWILASDLWLFRSDGNPEQRLISIVKGLTYVLVTAVILFLMMRQNSSSLRKLAKSLLDSDTRLRRIFDTTSEGLVVIDRHTLILDVNQRICDMFELPSNQIIGTRFSDMLSADSCSLLTARMAEPASEERRVADIEVRAPRRTYWVQAAWNNFDEGNQIRYVLLLSDISERVLREREIEGENTELEHRVKERTSALESVNQELKAFSYSISHDLREPIRAINGLSNILIEDYKEGQEQEAQEIIDRIQRNAIRMNGMIDSLLKLSRLTSAPLAVGRVSLSALAQKAFQETVSEADRQKIAWSVQDGLEAECDPNLIQIALANLFGNAWKFNKNKAGLIIEFGCSSENGSSAYYVRDNGIGFRSERAADIFKPFTRLSPEIEGEGIGLATVQRIITRHNGRLWAESDPDRGATFWFTLADSME